MKHRLHTLIGLLLIMTTPSCGRKQKNIFIFNKRPHSEKFNRLFLPAPKHITVSTVSEGCKIEWLAIDSPIELSEYHHKNAPAIAQLAGYHVYCLTKNSFVPHQPLCVTKENFFIDRNAKGKSGYCVRGLFLVGEKECLGPTSRIVFQEK